MEIHNCSGGIVFNMDKIRPRAVIGDQILFNECISTFRPKRIDIKEDQEYIGYLLLDFNLTEPLNFRHFSIEPSKSLKFLGFGLHLSHV